MATRRQRQRKLAGAQFHQVQCRERNRAQAAQAQTAARHREVNREVRRSAVIVDDPVTSGFSRADLEGATVRWLREHAQTLGIKRTSLMRKGGLIDAILSVQ